MISLIKIILIFLNSLATLHWISNFLWSFTIEIFVVKFAKFPRFHQGRAWDGNMTAGQRQLKSMPYDFIECYHMVSLYMSLDGPKYCHMTSNLTRCNLIRGFGRCRPYQTSKDNSRLSYVVACSTLFNPRGWPRPKHVTSPAWATTVNGPTRPLTLSQYNTCFCKKVPLFQNLHK